MKRRGSRKLTSPSLEDLDQLLSDALQPGLYMAPEDVFSMIGDLEAIEREVAKLGKKEPARAVTLYEGLMGACLEKLDQLEDDCADDLSAFVGELFQGWIRARQAEGDDAGATAAILVRRERDIAWDLELSVVAAKALDAPGAAAYERALRAELARALELAAREAEKPQREGSYVYFGESSWARILRRFLVARCDVAALETLCKSPAAMAEDCGALAGLFEERDEPARALTWVERGIALLPGNEEEENRSYIAAELPRRRRNLLVQLGRTEEAVAEAWAVFEREPCDDTLEEVLELAPEPEHGRWLARAMDAVSDEALGPALKVWLRGGAIDRIAGALAKLSDEALERTSRHLLESAAEAIESTAPALAGKVYRAVGWRTLTFGRGRSNAQAVAYFGNARRCWLAADRLDEWEALLVELRAAHGRKKSLLAEVQRLAGPIKSKQPSLLERGRSRWHRDGP
ncbi:MAG: hypothetical protein JWM80_2800 [Cyanobacteria bacterium RYN_339]|nr:hypothetical protein [Cyanobacteria bacterium RYN_339]